jgi:hypothetical protein
MSTPAQIEANRRNAQLSSGPASTEGKQRSSMNSTRHGLTGQTVIVTAEEKEAYDTHCIAFVEQYQPKTHEETELIQQYADQEWTLHQVNVQQINVLSMLNAATAHHMKAGSDFETLNAAVAPFYKQLNTLGIYEQRRRRAAAAILIQFKEFAAAREQTVAKAALVYKANKSQGKSFDPAEFGFDCSTSEIQTFLSRQAARADVQKFLQTPKS